MSDSPVTPPGQIHLSSATGSARNPFASGKLFGVRQTIAPPATRDLPTTLRTKSRFTVSPASGSSVHFASNSSKHPPMCHEVHFAGPVAPEKEAASASSAAFAVPELGENKRLPDRAYH